MTLDDLTRKKERRATDRAALDRLLDEVLVGTLATVSTDGRPWAVPMLFARDGDRILLHGSTGAGALRRVATGAEGVLAVHVVDGLGGGEEPVDRLHHRLGNRGRRPDHGVGERQGRGRRVRTVARPVVRVRDQQRHRLQEGIDDGPGVRDRIAAPARPHGRTEERIEGGADPRRHVGDPDHLGDGGGVVPGRPHECGAQRLVDARHVGPELVGERRDGGLLQHLVVHAGRAHRHQQTVGGEHVGCVDLERGGAATRPTVGGTVDRVTGHHFDCDRPVPR